MDKTALIQKITDTLPDNTNGDITPQDVREVLTEMVNSNESTLGEVVTVAGVTVGGLTDGTQLLATDTLTTIIKKMLVKEIAATYSSPNGSISSTVSGAVEAGTNITPTINAGFNRNDAGALSNYLLKRGATVLVDGPAIAAFNDSVQVGDTSVSYQATFTYGVGAIKNTNLGNPSPAGSIPAGSVNSNTVTVTGYRKAFYGTSGVTTTSAGIRALPGQHLNPGNGTQFTINIPVGATDVEFSYPATLQDVSVVKDNGTNFDIKGVFTKTTLNVDGANSFTAVSHKVYKYTPASPFSVAASYTVTI